MTRVKKAVNALKYRRNLLRAAKGFRFGRSKKERQAQEAIFHAGTYSFAHRRDKKNDFRKLWNVKINAASRPLGFSYSRLIGALKNKKVILDRKILSELAEKRPESFSRLISQIK